MTWQMTPEMQAESQQAASVYQGALIQLGAQAVGQSLTLWQDVPPLPKSSDSSATAKWLAVAVAYVMHRRLRARDLALAYYRYQRALTTGATIALPGQEHPPAYMTLPELKREFALTMNPTTAQTGVIPPPQPLSGQGSTDTSPDNSQAPTEPLIKVEVIPHLQESLDELEAQAEAEAKDNLQNLGPNNMDDKISKLPISDTPSTDAARQQAHKEAGNRQAATTARQVMNGARGPQFWIADADTSVIGWVRYSKTGTPCGFCAMLISRGVVYRSQTTARLDGEGDQYHDNCMCGVEPIFNMFQYRNDALFSLNREYQKLWPIVTKGLSGKSALSAWRRFIRQQTKTRASLAEAV